MKPEWDKTGTRITGKYCGFPYVGIVERSRVKFGGDVEYRVRLLDMINLSRDAMSPDWRSVLLVDRDYNSGEYELFE